MLHSITLHCTYKAGQTDCRDTKLSIKKRKRLPRSLSLKAQHVMEAKNIANFAGALQAEVRAESTTMCMGVGIGYKGNAPVKIIVETAGLCFTCVSNGSAGGVEAYRGGWRRVMCRLLPGGTRVQHAPVSEYVRQVMLPNLRALGVDLKYEVEKEGFFPNGRGGELGLRLVVQRHNGQKRTIFFYRRKACSI